jgi:PhnB protein
LRQLVINQLVEGRRATVTVTSCPALPRSTVSWARPPGLVSFSAAIRSSAVSVPRLDVRRLHLSGPMASCQMVVDRPPCETFPMPGESTTRLEFHSVTPRMVVRDAAGAVEFLRSAFGAIGHTQPSRPAEMRIGDSVVMVSQAGDREVFPAFLYIYVDDAENVYRRALAAGAVSVEEPWVTPYGDRRAMVRDVFGNLYQIATRNDTTTPSTP